MFFSKEKLAHIKSPTPYFVFNKKALLANIKSYKNNLPSNTEICYAMKSNSESFVLRTIAENGLSFEVASKDELELLKKIKVDPKKIVYGTSVRPEDHIKEFVKYGVDRFAFDSEEELIKIAKYSPNARVYVRVLVNDKSDSVFHMSEKFGAPLENAVKLLLKAKSLGLNTYGISFNVGSQARNDQAWARGLLDISRVMIELMNNGIKIQAVNIGGGFPYDYQHSGEIPSLMSIGKYIKKAFKNLPYPVELIAEPGRGLVADIYVLVVSVIAKNKRENGNWLFVDAGVYNALLEAMAYQGSIRYRITPLKWYKSNGREKFIITGPTGDNLDVIDPNAMLPANIKVGDKLAIYDTGAYSFTLSTAFNGFSKPESISLS